MTAIRVTKISEGKYEVIVAMQTTTQHLVMLSHDYYQELSRSYVSEEKLIKKSFIFLLERESNTMILERFDLQIIGDYFPEFEEKIKRSLS